MTHSEIDRDGLYVYKCCVFQFSAPLFHFLKVLPQKCLFCVAQCFFCLAHVTGGSRRANVRLLLSRLLSWIHALTELLKEMEKQTFYSWPPFMFSVLDLYHHTCNMLRFNRPRLHPKLFSSIKGHDWVFRLALPVVTTAAVIGQLDDFLEFCCVPIGRQSILMFAGLDAVYNRSRVPGASTNVQQNTLRTYCMIAETSLIENLSVKCTLFWSLPVIGLNLPHCYGDFLMDFSGLLEKRDILLHWRTPHSSSAKYYISKRLPLSDTLPLSWAGDFTSFCTKTKQEHFHVRPCLYVHVRFI